MIRVVIADDHPMFRYGLEAMLESVEDIDVVGACGDGRQLLALVEDVRPDVVLTDLAMPHVDGVAATQALRERHPNIAVVVLTMLGDDASVAAAVTAGATGYVLKGAEGDTISRTIRAAAAGDSVYGAGVAERVASLVSTATDHRDAAPFPDLTTREREILDLMAAGGTNGQIARRLSIADKTVRNHISMILLKLQVPDRVSAVIRARDAGLGRLRAPERPDPADRAGRD
jgi:DNA-binding NarL/FixJ family response regulator